MILAPGESVGLKDTYADASSTELSERRILVAGKGLRIASIKDEDWLEGGSIVNPEAFIARVQALPRGADLFTFSETVESPTSRFPKYHFEWDNTAVVPITTFKDWWENRVPQETRKNVRRSQRRGLVVKQADFDDTLVAGIKRIYDETPLRQGRRFWHYGKDFEAVRIENSSYLDRSDFFGAYFENELVGFIKVVYVNKIARIMQILSMNPHFDKRPTNALLAKAIEQCCRKEMKFFAYGKYVYGNKHNSPVTEFKRRNGFEKREFPRYYVPLTLLGRVALRLRLHQGVRNLLPESATELLLKLRSRLYAKTLPASFPPRDHHPFDRS